MSEFKDKFNDWLDDAWKVDAFIDEYNWEQERRQRRAKREKPLCKEVKHYAYQQGKERFHEKHLVIALTILGGLAGISIWCPFFWIAFFAFLFWM